LYLLLYPYFLHFDRWEALTHIHSLHVSNSYGYILHIQKSEFLKLRINQKFKRIIIQPLFLVTYIFYFNNFTKKFGEPPMPLSQRLFFTLYYVFWTNCLAIRPSAMSLLKVPFKILNHWKGGLKMIEKWGGGERVEWIQLCWSLTQRATWQELIGQNRRVSRTRRQARVSDAEREKTLWINGDTCNLLIDCLDFYHFNNLNSIISLQIYFFFKIFFYQNSWFFFVYK